MLIPFGKTCVTLLHFFMLLTKNLQLLASLVHNYHGSGKREVVL